MRYSFIATLALASAVVALPRPQGLDDGSDMSDSEVSSAMNSGDSTLAQDSSETFPTNTEPSTTSTGSSSYPIETPPSFPNTTGPALSTSTGSATGLLDCGPAFYSPDEYTCYAGFLCPIEDGVATLQCGDACYLLSLYSCTGGVLSSLSEDTVAGSGSGVTSTGDAFGFPPVTFISDAVRVSSSVASPTADNSFPTSTGDAFFPTNTTDTGLVPTTTAVSRSAFGFFPTTTSAGVFPAGTGGLFPTAVGTAGFLVTSSTVGVDPITAISPQISNTDEGLPTGTHAALAEPSLPSGWSTMTDLPKATGGSVTDTPSERRASRIIG